MKLRRMLAVAVLIGSTQFVSPVFSETLASEQMKAWNALSAEEKKSIESFTIDSARERYSKDNKTLLDPADPSTIPTLVKEGYLEMNSELGVYELSKAQNEKIRKEIQEFASSVAIENAIRAYKKEKGVSLRETNKADVDLLVKEGYLIFASGSYRLSEALQQEANDRANAMLKKFNEEKKKQPPVTFQGKVLSDTECMTIQAAIIVAGQLDSEFQSRRELNEANIQKLFDKEFLLPASSGFYINPKKSFELEKRNAGLEKQLEAAKEAREAAREKAIACTIRMLRGAVMMHNMDNPDEQITSITPETIQKLIQGKFLKGPLPNFGIEEFSSEGDISKDGYIFVTYRGKKIIEPKE